MNEQDWMDNAMFEELEQEFDYLWLDICDMAERMGVCPSYVEEECFILGELFPLDTTVSPALAKDLMRRMRESRNNNSDFKFNPRPGSM